MKQRILFLLVFIVPILLACSLADLQTAAPVTVTQKTGVYNLVAPEYRITGCERVSKDQLRIGLIFHMKIITFQEKGSPFTYITFSYDVPEGYYVVGVFAEGDKRVQYSMSIGPTKMTSDKKVVDVWQCEDYQSMQNDWFVMNVEP